MVTIVTLQLVLSNTKSGDIGKKQESYMYCLKETSFKDTEC